MRDDLLTADRSLALLARTSACFNETTLTLWAVLALLLVVAVIVLGGPS